MFDDPSVPLSHYRTHGAGVLLICLACQQTTVLELERVISGLVNRGLGDETTGIKAVADHMTQPCARCGQRRWETRPAFRPASMGVGE